VAVGDETEGREDCEARISFLEAAAERDANSPRWPSQRSVF
jgi:hypothetical protein